MLINAIRNSKKDQALIVHSSSIRKNFNYNKNDFDLGREYALTFNIDNHIITLKGRSAHSTGYNLRVGLKSIPTKILKKYNGCSRIPLDLIEARKIETR